MGTERTVTFKLKAEIDPSTAGAIVEFKRMMQQAQSGGPGATGGGGGGGRAGVGNEERERQQIIKRANAEYLRDQKAIVNDQKRSERESVASYRASLREKAAAEKAWSNQERAQNVLAINQAKDVAKEKSDAVKSTTKAQEQATNSVDRLNRRIYEGGRQAMEGSMHVIRGFALIGAAGGKSAQKIMEGFILVEASFSIVKGGMQIVHALSKAWEAYAVAVKGAAVAHTLLAAAEARSIALGGIAAVAGGGARGVGGGLLVRDAGLLAGGGVVAKGLPWGVRAVGATLPYAAPVAYSAAMAYVGYHAVKAINDPETIAKYGSSRAKMNMVLRASGRDAPDSPEDIAIAQAEKKRTRTMTERQKRLAWEAEVQANMAAQLGFAGEREEAEYGMMRQTARSAGAAPYFKRWQTGEEGERVQAQMALGGVRAEIAAVGAKARGARFQEQDLLKTRAGGGFVSQAEMDAVLQKRLKYEQDIQSLMKEELNLQKQANEVSIKAAQTRLDYAQKAAATASGKLGGAYEGYKSTLERFGAMGPGEQGKIESMVGFYRRGGHLPQEILGEIKPFLAKHEQEAMTRKQVDEAVGRSLFQAPEWKKGKEAIHGLSELQGPINKEIVVQENVIVNLQFDNEALARQLEVALTARSREVVDLINKIVDEKVGLVRTEAAMRNAHQSF